MKGVADEEYFSQGAEGTQHSCGAPGDEMRLFLTEEGYQNALISHRRRKIKIKRYTRVVEGHLGKEKVLKLKW